MVFRALIIAAFLLFPGVTAGEVLTSDTVWSNEIVINDDILVPDGVTLTILAGTVVRVLPADSTKIDPEYVSHRTEITVRGTLKIKGEPDAPVSFFMGDTDTHDMLDPWAGIIIDAGKAEISWCRVTGAETGITVTHGTLDGENVSISSNRYGLIIQGEDSRVSLKKSTIEKNDYGLFLFNGARLTREETVVSANSKKNLFSDQSAYPVTTGEEYRPDDKMITSVYRDDALPGVTVWQGRILVEGLVRLPPEGQLIIMPGTIVEFSKRDTNNDGIGENGLMIQGRFIAKGTSREPILFRSAEPRRHMGDWDSINILGSDRVQNLIEFCRIEDAYRGMHFHFANVAITNSVLSNNYRGAQFQESLVYMGRNLFYSNKSAVQARDSEVVFEYNDIIGNQNGANFFRLDLKARHNTFAHNEQDGLRIREGVTQVKDNRMLGNRFGLLVADSNYADVESNYLGANLEGGLALRNSDHVRISGNAIQKNGINGIVIRESRGMISGNSIGGNGERGIAIVSFSGSISNNNIFANTLYGIGLEGITDIEAQGNWWDDSNLAGEIYDANDEPGLGTVRYKPQSPTPFPFVWAWSEIPVAALWGGIIEVPAKVTVAQPATLQIRPGTQVRFGSGAGLEILGALESKGTAEKRILYTAMAGEEAGYWDEISLQQAGESSFVHSDFSYGTWGIHSHFTSLAVTGCRFTNNYGGIRFRSGPLHISGSLFSRNTISIRSYRGVGEINGNEISGNEIGIFIREKGAGLAIHHNNIYANERYGLRLGDFNRQQVDARHNWWGGENLSQIIFDQADESYIGPVLFEPVLSEKMDIIVQ
ncbi:right-handed parallel beta-helix repeat-containing protein [Thermodesulfobacteriota bacterium]